MRGGGLHRFVQTHSCPGRTPRLSQVLGVILCPLWTHHNQLRLAGLWHRELAKTQPGVSLMVWGQGPGRVSGASRPRSTVPPTAAQLAGLAPHRLAPSTPLSLGKVQQALRGPSHQRHSVPGVPANTRSLSASSPGHFQPQDHWASACLALHHLF